jgi:translation initiation factor IF-3
VNEAIKAERVRMIDSEGSQLGVFSLEEALSFSRRVGLDLVEVQPNMVPPVVKLMNYGKYLFKQEKFTKKKSLICKIKEIKFRINTDLNDYNLKIKQLCTFLRCGSKVKVTVWFRGRENLYKNFGTELVQKICLDLSDFGKFEHPPKEEGRGIGVVFVPKVKV